LIDLNTNFLNKSEKRMRKSYILGVFIVLAFCCFLNLSCKEEETTPTSPTLGAHPNDADRPIPYNYSNWMANVTGSKYLSEITIPGTHDACADLHSSEQGTMWYVTIAQDFRISNQLELGVRWLDIRLNDDGGTMTTYHGPYYLHKNFTDIVNQVLSFLDNHPTETVIMMIKQEHSSRSDDDFANGVMGYLNWAHPGRFWMEDRIPTLGEVRGKVVITRQFRWTHGYDMGVPLIWNDNTPGSYGWTDNGNSVYVQDHYSLNWVAPDNKVSEIENCITKAHNEPYPYRCYYLNFTSGEATATLVPLLNIAAYINPRINSFLLSKPTWHNCGVIFVNFAGGSDDGTVPNDLVKTIVNCNEFITPVPSVTIGTQIWGSKNLNVTHYQNGDPIYHCTNNAEWQSMTTGAYCYYNNDSANYASQGILYNWYAVADPRGLAPTGWHVAFKEDWDLLTYYLGGSGAANKLKEAGTVHWGSGNTSTNSTGFTALPNNIREFNGDFEQHTYFGNWWTGNYNVNQPIYGYYISMSGNSPDVNSSQGVKLCGFPVRIVRK